MMTVEGLKHLAGEWERLADKTYKGNAYIYALALKDCANQVRRHLAVCARLAEYRKMKAIIEANREKIVFSC